MRPELTRIEQIELYLSGAMNEADRLAFEQEKMRDPELSAAVETQSLMVQAIERRAILATVTAFAPKTTGMSSPLAKFKWPIIFSVIVAGAVTVWQLWGRDSDSASDLNQSRTEQHNSGDPLVEQKVDEEEVGDITEGQSSVARNTTSTTTEKKRFGGLDTWVSPDVQRVEIDPTKTELIECNEGTVILFPKGVFQNSKGKMVTEMITVEIIEVLTMDKIVSYNLTTMSDGKALRSGGMLFLQAKRGDEKLSVRPGKFVHIEIPTDQYNPDMMVWDGKPDGKGGLNWMDPRDMERYLVPVDMASLDFLPAGFREEVRITLPYRKYTKSSVSLEDSMYYSLSGFCTSDQNVQTDNQEKVRALGKVNTSVESIDQEINTRAHRKTNTKRSTNEYGKVVFNNLPDGIEFIAEITGSGITNEIVTFQRNVINGSITNVPSNASIDLISPFCDTLSFSVGKIIPNKATYLDCSELSCNRSPGATSGSAMRSNACYIDPASIFAIHQKKYENTFIATREFAERLQVLHKIPDAQSLLELYINQLDKNLYEIDGQVAGKVNEPYRSVFKAFAREKLTNVRPNGQDYAKLSQYYSEQLKAKQKQEKARRAQYENKSAAELKALQAQMNQLSTEYSSNRTALIEKFNESGIMNATNGSVGGLLSIINSRVKERPNVGTQASYSISWYGSAWTNIDTYFHELSSGELVVVLNVPDQKGSVIYQSINSLKTMVSLNNTSKGYEAHFPITAQEVYRQSSCIGVARRPDKRLAISYAIYDPYASKTVKMSDWQEYSEKEFKQRISQIYPHSMEIINSLGREDKMIRETLERKQRAEEEQRKRQEELDALDQKFKEESAKIREEDLKIRKEQQEEKMYMQHLIDFIDPCLKKVPEPFQILNAISDENSEELVEFPDMEASYPGGSGALNTYILSNTNYPRSAIEQGLSGTVYVYFIVSNSGTIRFEKIAIPTRGMEALEQEAERLVTAMPDWEPAQAGSSAVATRVRLPIIFTLE